MSRIERSSDDYAALTTRERALVAGWEAEVERLREALTLIAYMPLPNATDAPDLAATVARKALDA